MHFTALLCTFALLMEKDGGIRPCDVLATCASQGATFYSASHTALGKISESQYNTRLFDVSFSFLLRVARFVLPVICVFANAGIQDARHPPQEPGNGNKHGH